MEIRKLACTMAAAGFTASACILTASAEKVEERAFPSYTYSLWGNVSDCPAPYTLEGRITGVDLGLSDFRANQRFVCRPKRPRLCGGERTGRR